jgi:hypothetical protein
MSKTKQDRWTCLFCKASGWWTPSTHIGHSPMVQHDRPDGRDCVKAHTPMSILDLGALLRKRDRDRREESPDQDPSNGDGFDRDF